MEKENDINYDVVWEVVDKMPKENDTLYDAEFSDLEDKIRKDTNVESTAKTYINIIKNYVNSGHKIDNLNSIKSYVKDIPLTSQEKFLYSMIKANKVLGNEKIIPQIQNIVRTTKDVIQLTRFDNNGDKKETISLEELKQRADAVPSSNVTQKSIANLYTNEVPWRSDTVVHMTKDKRKKDDNIVSLNNKEIEFNKYKTVGTYGKKKMPIRTNVARLMRKQFKDTGSIWLLPDPKDPTRPMSANTLSHIIAHNFGVGVRDLRHAYITDAKKQLNKEEFSQLCYRMNTSCEMGTFVYNDNK